METNFAKLLKELCSLRQEMKEEIVTLKSNAKRVEKSVEELWATTRGTLGGGGGGEGGEVPNTLRKNGKYRNTASKIV